MRWLHQVWIRGIQWAIDLNEQILFYPRLRRYYQSTGIQSPTILDVGSNKGQSIIFFRQLYQDARIFGFEPNRLLFQKLEKRWGSDPRILLYPMGVSDHVGELDLQITVTDETSTFEALNLSSEYLKMKARVLGVTPESMVVNRQRVRVLRLADFMHDQQLSRVDILKIDTEGHEYKCLNGLFIGEIPWPEYIQLEVHEDDMYVHREQLRQIPELLRSKGYRQDVVIPHGFGNFSEVIYKRI